MVKHLSTMWETRVWSLGWEDPLEKEMAIHSSTIAWKIPWVEEPGRLQSMGLQRVRHDWATSRSRPPFGSLICFLSLWVCFCFVKSSSVSPFKIPHISDTIWYICLSLCFIHFCLDWTPTMGQALSLLLGTQILNLKTCTLLTVHEANKLILNCVWLWQK